MSSDWITTTIGEQATLQRGFDITKAEQKRGNVPVISSGGTNSHHSTAMVKGPGVVLGRKGVVGSVYFVREDYWPHDTTLWVKDFHGNDELFTYYFFLSKAKDLAALDVGSANPTLNRNHVHPIKTRWPLLAEQRTISATLKALDDRITLLRETNATLEAIAQGLFKSWFVDFDPVHAKQQGSAPKGMDEATAALFPDSFDESESGLVPKGWKLSTVGETFILTMGQSPPGDTYNQAGDGLPFFQGRTDFGFRFPSQRVFCTAPTRLADAGDTLVSVRAPVGDVNMALEKCCLGRGVAGIKHPNGYRSFAFYAIRGLRSRFDLFDSEGTVFGSINKKDFQALPVIEPCLEALSAYDNIASPLDQRIIENEEKLRTLATLRDTLLPRLISGQLRLPEAEAAVAAVL